MKIVFCGTPAFAVPALARLLAEPEFTVAAVVTQPDRARGRGGAVQAPPVKELALAHEAYVYQPEKINSDSAGDFFTRLQPEVVVIIAYGQIIPARLIALPRLGWINLHASLLPKYRGAAPIQWAIAHGETRTGLTTMQIDAGLDTGPTLLRWETDIGPNETAPELSQRLALAGADLVVDTLRQLAGGSLRAQPQDHAAASLAPILKKEDGQVDWRRPAAETYNRMRGFAPWPGAYTHFRGTRCQVWGRPGEALETPSAPGSIQQTGAAVSVVCGSGTTFHLTEVQPEGRKRMAAADFARGARLQPGDHFG
jgi:methionyl-tRNA formyltransferase